MTACRICGSTAIERCGEVEYLAGFPCAVYDCADCGCRFTPHDASAHDRLHRERALSYYEDYVALADRCAVLFKNGDRDGLRRELSTQAKYRFVIEHLDRAPRTARVLEVGCARGHLTSYAILNQLDVLGVDVSPEAVGGARERFGNHFALADSTEARSRAPFDVIYHVGLIGCVSDPIGLTRQLLSQLRPGGELFFNAPNRGALYLRGQLWLDSAPPPDLVTLFPEGFWQKTFSNVARVTEAVDEAGADDSLRIAVNQRLGVGWRAPETQPATVRGFQWGQASPLIARAATKAARTIGLSNLATARVTEFGMFVRMVKTA